MKSKMNIQTAGHPETALRAYADYACLRCGRALQDCTCELTPCTVYQCDYDLQEMCHVLFQKRYQVTGVCSGSFYGSHRVWVELKCPYKFGAGQPLPEGFELSSRGGAAVLRASIPYALSFEEFEAQRHKLLDSLRAWANALPEFAW